MRKAPCKNCSKRYLGCHDKCPEYQEFKRDINERKELVAQERAVWSKTYSHKKAIKKFKKKNE